MASNRATKSGFAAEAQRKVSFLEQVVAWFVEEATTWPDGFLPTGHPSFFFNYYYFDSVVKRVCLFWKVCHAGKSIGGVSSLGQKGGSDSRNSVFFSEKMSNEWNV